MRAHAVVAAAAVAAAVTLARADGDGKSPTGGGDALTALVGKLDAVTREVGKLRGLPVKKPVAGEVVDRDAMHDRVVARLGDAKVQAELAATGLVMARLGEIPAGTDYAALVGDVLAEQIAGSYDAERKQLTLVRGSGLDDAGWADMVVAHELEHALADQSFDLRKFLDVPAGDADAAMARRAVVEGDGIATMVEVSLARQHAAVDWSNAEVATLIDKMMEQGATACAAGSACAGAFERAPFAVREQLVFPYRAGFRFVAALRHRQSWSAVDAAYRKPPRSTEQILHPERYLAGDEPVGVVLDPPPSLKAWKLGASIVWGEHGFGVFLRAHGVDAAVAAEAAAGWGGDRLLVLTSPDDPSPARACAIARMEWDSEADAIEAAEAAVRAVDELVVGATFERAEGRDRWVTVDGTVAMVERRGPAVVMMVGVPAGMAAGVAPEVWALGRVKRK